MKTKSPKPSFFYIYYNKSKSIKTNLYQIFKNQNYGFKHTGNKAATVDQIYSKTKNTFYCKNNDFLMLAIYFFILMLKKKKTNL